MVHPRFLERCRDGSNSCVQFDTWLQQGYLFVKGFAGFAGSVLSKAEEAGNLEVLAGGIGALAD